MSKMLALGLKRKKKFQPLSISFTIQNDPAELLSNNKNGGKSKLSSLSITITFANPNMTSTLMPKKADWKHMG